jgi:hypothetical protein
MHLSRNQDYTVCDYLGYLKRLGLLLRRELIPPDEHLPGTIGATNIVMEKTSLEPTV